MEQKFLDILTILSPEGYYARNIKERKIFKSLEIEKKVQKKRGTKFTYVLANTQQQSVEYSIEEFLKELRLTFSELRSSYKPFVSIAEIKNKMLNIIPLNNSKFDTYILNLYEDGYIDLEQSLANNESDSSTGILSKNGKIFNYILDIS